MMGHHHLPHRIVVLLGQLEGHVPLVLQTVAEQYLIELGEETLRHLRNPDHEARNAATNAIEKLKFYWEARNAFKESVK